MRRGGLIVVLLTGLVMGMMASGNATAQGVPDEVQESVVKVFSTYRGPDFGRPWSKNDPMEFTGTGFIIEGDFILTNAHVVEYATQLFIQPRNSADKLRVNLVAISHGIDLAVLEIRRKSEKEAFHAERTALALKDAMPKIGATVQTVGYPEGGEQQSITEGVVSRIEYTGYNLDVAGLRIQTDAAINHGNSGGPVVLDGEVIGVAFAGMDYAENIGYIIPVEEVKIFLADVEDGEYDGKPTLRVGGYFTCENDTLRNFLKLRKDQTGLVYRKQKDRYKSEFFEDWDLIARIGEYDIDNVGMVTLNGDLRVNWQYLVPIVAQEDAVEIGVIRDGEEAVVHAQISNSRPMLLPWLENEYPEYFIIGPLVFSKVTRDHAGGYYFVLLAMQGSSLATRMEDLQKFEGEELVAVMSEFLPHPITKGYVISRNPTLRSIDGVEVKSLAHAVELIRDADGEFITFEFHDNMQEALIFDREELLEVTEEILEDNSIRRQGSKRLMKVWED